MDLITSQNKERERLTQFFQRWNITYAEKFKNRSLKNQVLIFEIKTGNKQSLVKVIFPDNEAPRIPVHSDCERIVTEAAIWQAIVYNMKVGK